MQTINDSTFLPAESAQKPIKNELSLTGKILIGITGTYTNDENIFLPLANADIKWIETNLYLSLGGIAVGLTIICVPFVSPALRKYCLPYIPATDAQVENVFKALGGKGKKGKLVDLGSGDGRIVIGL